MTNTSGDKTKKRKTMGRRTKKSNHKSSRTSVKRRASWERVVDKTAEDFYHGARKSAKKMKKFGGDMHVLYGEMVWGVKGMGWSLEEFGKSVAKGAFELGSQGESFGSRSSSRKSRRNRGSGRKTSNRRSRL